MRVLWITPGFAPNESMVNSVPPMQLLAKALVARGIELEIIAINYPYTGKPYLWNGIQVHSACKFKPRKLRWINWIYSFFYAIKAHKREPFQVIHSFWVGPAWLVGNKLSQLFGVPHVNTLMGQDVLPSNKYLKYLKYYDYDDLIAISDYQKQVLQQTTGKSTNHIIYWGIGKEDIVYNLTQKRPIDILGCGSLIPLKNYELWLEVVFKIAKKYPQVQALLIGSGTEYEKLKSKIAQAQLSNQISIKEFIPRPELLDLMAQSKIFLHTANYEGFGMVMAEAYANGCKIVSTPVGIATKIADIGNNADELFLQIEDKLIGKPHHIIYQTRFIEEVAYEYELVYSNKIYVK
ncbi:MAG TPA: glycosyltransferase family 4 protein [Saprospiraceae bacterium]|nr:glycosyltransferase family 4 protein [Saprospiraceae bacterium]HPN68246.1 glycosyltransferase family 4 protein [Saprospiraceae bacterium]